MGAKKMCEDEHKRIPVRVSRKVPKKVCDDGYADPLSVSEVVGLRSEQASSSAGGQRRKNKKHSKDSDKDSSDEKKDSDEDSSDEEKERSTKNTKRILMKMKTKKDEVNI